MSYFKQNLCLSWNNLSVWSKESQILHNVNGYVSSGSILAVMGSSGSGKTTLLSTLSFRSQLKYTGDITINKNKVDGTLMMKYSGFAPQKELWYETMRVNECLFFTGRLRISGHEPDEEVLTKVTDVISALNLDEYQWSLISELPNGAKKKLSFALQFLTNPSILFCDEPTTGLDSEAAVNVLSALRKLAARGTVVICSIHNSPNYSSDLFDQLLLLAQGKVAYFGDISAASQYFKKLNIVCPNDYNQLEFYVNKVSIIPDDEQRSALRLQEICEHYANSKHKLDSIDAGCNIQDTGTMKINTKERRISCERQIKLLLWRNALDMKRNYKNILLEFCVFIALALVISVPYQGLFKDMSSGITLQYIQSLQGILYLTMVETAFVFCCVMLNTVPSQLPILNRDLANGLYKPVTFHVAKMLIMIPKTLIQPLFYCLLIFTIAGLAGDWIEFLAFYIPVAMCAMVSTAYGMFISTAFDSISTAVLVTVPLDCIFLAYSGIFINLSTAHYSWFRYISHFYYTLEAISIQQWSLIDASNSTVGLKITGTEILQDVDYADTNYYQDISGLILLYIVYNILGWICMIRRGRQSAVY